MNLSPIAMRVRDIQREELVNKDGFADKVDGNNNTKYNTAYYKRRVRGGAYKWCVVFQWWCMQKAGVPAAIFPRTASVAAVREFYEKKDRFFSKPVVGDLVIYKESHIGFVEKLLAGGKIQTIEGNWDDRVARRTMKANSSKIAGFCRPAYDQVKAPVRSDGGMTEEILHGLPNIVPGSKGVDVRRLHALMHAAGRTELLQPDGTFANEYSDLTKNAIRALTGKTTITQAQWRKLLDV